MSLICLQQFMHLVLEQLVLVGIWNQLLRDLVVGNLACCCVNLLSHRSILAKSDLP